MDEATLIATRKWVAATLLAFIVGVMVGIALYDHVLMPSLHCSSWVHVSLRWA